MNLLKRNKEKILNGKEKNIIKISEQDNKNNQLDIEIEKFEICNKVLEDGKQKEEDSKGKYDLFLSAQKKELINALKRKEEKEEKKRCNIQRISTKLKEKLKKKQIGKIIINNDFIKDKVNDEKNKIIDKFKKKNLKYINLKERNNQKSKKINNKKNELEQKDENSNLLSDEIKQLKNKTQILENENNEQKNQIMTLSENISYKLSTSQQKEN